MLTEKERLDALLSDIRSLGERAETERRARRVLEVLVNPKCKCGDLGRKGRLCPYASEIRNETVECGCCDPCERECCADI